MKLIYKNILKPNFFFHMCQHYDGAQVEQLFKLDSKLTIQVGKLQEKDIWFKLKIYINQLNKLFFKNMEYCRVI